MKKYIYSIKVYHSVVNSNNKPHKKFINLLLTSNFALKVGLEVYM